MDIYAHKIKYAIVLQPIVFLMNINIRILPDVFALKK